jgi:glycosyltransferase involved in cell wall biosynthesis
VRIAFFAWESLHTVPVGGGAVHVTELAAALERRGHEVHVFARLGGGQSTYEIIDGVHYHRCPIQLAPDFVTEMNNMGNAFVYFLAQTEAFQGAPFDVVHGHDWLAAKGLVQAKNDRGRRIVLTFHSTEFGRNGNSRYNGRAERIHGIEAEGAYVADRVVAVSPALADEVKWLYHVPGYKIRVIYNGIHCSRFDGYVDPGTYRRRFGIGPLDPMVLYVGRMCVQKGPDILLEAGPGILEHRPDAKMVFVGDGHMRSHLEHRARHLGIGHAVRFVGAMDANGDLVNLFKSTDVVCVPSRNEPFGIVVLEAWAAGKPVVATHNGGPHYFVEHGVDGFLVYDNPQSVCWGVNTIFGNFEHARWMGERGRVKAAYGFSWDAIAAQTEDVYHELTR